MVEFAGIKVPPSGPLPARIMIVGEAPGEEEIKQLRPFCGASGVEFTKMLHEAGLIRSECFVTNVCPWRPPQNEIDAWIWPRKTGVPEHFVHALGERVDPRVARGIEELERAIVDCQPNVIIALGGTALWALTGQNGITKWRGSVMPSREWEGRRWKVVPTIHPAAVLREWSTRYLAVNDLRRAREQAESPHLPTRTERFTVRPTFDQVRETLHFLLTLPEDALLACDIETRSRQIACIAFAWSEADAICIPFMCVEGDGSYWCLEAEVELTCLIRKILARSAIVGQNFIYDSQYTIKQWGVWPRLLLDTMLLHHVHWLGLLKSLDFQSSFYLPDHLYWKDEGKEWDTHMPEEQLWVYNCRDAVTTYRLVEPLRAVEAQLKLPDRGFGTPPEIQHSMFPIFLEAMLRGVRQDERAKREIILELSEAERVRQEFLNALVGRPLNVQSPKQLQEFFYEELGIAPIKNRKSNFRPTTNAEALERIGRADPLLRMLCATINELRSLKNSHAVCNQPIDHDGRMRCSYNIAGTETLRLSSSADAFGLGTNLQNITSGDEAEGSAFPLPNLRRLFIPDPQRTLGEFDGGQADARVVAADAEDELLLAIFADPSRDLHNENCELIFGAGSWRDNARRQQAKIGVHLTNYGGTPRTLAEALGITVHEATKFQSRWFDAHPAIKRWHDRILSQLQSVRFVENRFGYRRYYFDRIDSVLKEALAWIPQSTVGLVTNLGIRNVWRDAALRAAGVELLLQVHDSSVWQWPTYRTYQIIPQILAHLAIPIPYSPPLVIPVSVKTSERSWGECKKMVP